MDTRVKPAFDELRVGMRPVLLRRLLRHRRLRSGHRGAAHVARLRLVVAAYAVHGLAVVHITRSCSVHLWT